MNRGRQTGKTVKRWLMVLMVLAAAMTLLCGYSSLDEKIFDGADLLDARQEQSLQEEITQLAGDLSLDIIIVTTDDAGGKDAQDYADDFYDEHAFGYEQAHGSGILFLIDMDNREYYISTAGQAIAMYTDREIDIMLDDEIRSYMLDGDFYGACEEFLRCVKVYGTNSDVAENGYWDSSSDTFVQYSEAELRANARAARLKKVLSLGGILSRLGISLIIGAVGVGIMAIRVRHNSAPGGRVYMKPGSEHIRERRDFKVNTTVTTRHIEKNHGNSGGGGGGSSFSSSHSSGGGHSHGGGGRGF